MSDLGWRFARWWPGLAVTPLLNRLEPSSALVGNRQLNVSRVLLTLLLPNPKKLQSLEPKFRQAIQPSRVNAVAIPEFESQRLLVALKSIDPAWHRVWKPAV